MTFTFTIRPAQDADIVAMAHIQTVLNPNYPYTAETFADEIQEAKEHPLGLHWAYWVAEADNKIVAYASVTQYAGLYHPDRYHADVQVLPQARSQGIGAAMAELLRAHLQQRGAREVIAGAYETETQAISMLKKYGLHELQRYFDSHLDLSTFDFNAWPVRFPAGIRVLTFTELKAEQGDEKATQTYYDVYTATLKDVPAPGERTLPDLESFGKRLSDEHFLADSVYFAVTGTGQAVAFTELWAWEGDPSRLKIGFTCVRQGSRRQGLALALKLHAMREAHAQGIRQITTNTESGNAPMLALNARLGFVNDTAYVEYRWGKV